MNINDLLPDVSRETLDALDHYETLLRKWNPKINLVAPSTLAEARTRHFIDSAQILSRIPVEATRHADLGTGGGFPGLVIAILAKQHLSQLQTTMVESDQRKASFLRTVLRETNVKATVKASRIEQTELDRVNLLTARALAPLDKLLGFADQHLQKGGTALFLKGKTWGKEVEDAQLRWKFEYKAHTSVTDPSAVILEIRDLSNV